MPTSCWCVAVAVRLSRSDSPSVAQWNRTEPEEGRQGQVSISATSCSAWLTEWQKRQTPSLTVPPSPTPYVHTHTHKRHKAPMMCSRTSVVVMWQWQWSAVQRASCCRKRSHFIPWCQRLSCTHIDARGVKRTLVGDAGVANGIGEAAVSQEAPPAVNDGPHHGHSESDGWSGCHESCGKTDWEKWPRLGEEQEDKKSHQESKTRWLIRWSLASSWGTGASATVNR